MIAIHQPPSAKKYTPNLLPVRINHNGRINNTHQYFKPTSKPTSSNTTSSSSDIPPTAEAPTEAPTQTSPPTGNSPEQGQRTAPEATQHAYFRGRHLLSTTLSLPDNYTGAILQFTSEPHAASSSSSHPNPAVEEENEEEGEEEDDAVPMEITKANVLGSFDQILIWGHAETVDEGKDAFVRGVREWIGFAEGMHLDED